MFRNNIKIALRNFQKQKSSTFINLFGLTVGLSCFLLIALYIFDEMTYDGFHKKGDRIYRVIETKTSAAGKETKVVSVAANISEQMKKDYPSDVMATRFSVLGRANISNAENEKVFYESYYIADESFFRVFDFPVLGGDSKTALRQPQSVVLTKETAIKIFGTPDVVGKTLMTDRDSLPFTISSVITVPGNSHLQFNMLFSEATLYRSQGFMDFFNTDWSSNTFVTYLHLNKQSPAQAAQVINNLVKSHRENDPDGKSSFALQPLKKIHFYSAGLEGNTDKPGNIKHMWIFGLVALFVLLIASINYINLSTAGFATRSKEIAVRKVAGATMQNLVKQFLTEASLLTAISLLLSLLIVKTLLQRFNAFTEKQISFGLDTDYRVWLGVIGVAVFVGLVSGIYPAFFQSGLKPYVLLKNKLNIGKGNLSIRRALVVLQFSLSIIMIIATIVVYQQLKYVDTADMGFNKEQLLVVDINSGLVRRGANTIKGEFAKLSGVKNVSVSSRVPGEWKSIPKAKLIMPGKFSTAGEDVYFLTADDQFLQTFQVKLLNGRNFSAIGSNDSNAVLLNETAAKMMGISTPTSQPVQIPSVSFAGNASNMQQPFNANVVGIVRDFNFQSMRDKIAPMVLGYKNNPVHNIDYFTVRLETGNVEGTLKSMEAILRGIDPAHLFEYNFLDKQWENFYRDDQKRQAIFLGVAMMTILIACLGLFGLATYAAQQRVKEIGVRKVLGASVGSIVAMLSKDFAKLVVIASVIAFPVAWWAMNNWLQDFSYRIHIGWWVFLLAGLGALLIALVTVSFQTIQAALANPVKNLRSE